MSHGTVLVVGATGHVGHKVVALLKRRGIPVRVLVRPGSDVSRIEGDGVTVARGDMMDPASLDAAFAGVDTVISCAAGYTRRRKSDSDQIDRIGNQNLAQAAKKAGVRRYILNSILRCDDAPGVLHFEHKAEAEAFLHKIGVPFVAIRPGAFLDQAEDFLADGVKKRMFFGIGDRDVSRWTWIYTWDLAEALVRAVDADDRIVGKFIDVGWSTGPVSNQELATVIAKVTGVALKVRIVPWFVVGLATRITGIFGLPAAELGRMFLYFRTGRYVADTKLHDELLGPSPTKEDAIRRWAIEKGLVAK
jgi:YD repeat-containing protein